MSSLVVDMLKHVCAAFIDGNTDESFILLWKDVLFGLYLFVKVQND